MNYTIINFKIIHCIKCNFKRYILINFLKKKKKKKKFKSGKSVEVIVYIWTNYINILNKSNIKYNKDEIR
ncbi:hypothetical protein PFTANZ_03001 [Plasmodium falciparum Tanzania (2000708)]|uniref:Uncharacterized protein n=1 Tax=Plasmodium falciparum Tanzania (2000708) TaxID=1036725 RepID=A0A024W6I3_PLAFA|nr:hypothetical protein PFTANZ_03001 [Plasmodium falciparum Tanzania (2000708)]